MIFNSLQFILLYPLLFLLYYVFPASWIRVRNAYLLLVSYSLYMQWKPVYAMILLFVTAVTYCFALLLNKARRPKKVLTAGVSLALLPLAFFKYFNFINESVGDLLAVAGLNFQLPGLNWAIPIGISFFTFQALGYLWDVYYKRQEAERDFLVYALFVSFFPSILSGPINKASLLIPQLKRARPYFNYPKAVMGMRMLLWGMFLKVVVADRAGLYVDSIFGSYTDYNGMTCLVASLFYTVQIYADFAGYSLMAIGVGKTLGFDLTENFRCPYFAVSVTDFWRRWHISLSTWLKDYVYIPLGGSRCSKVRNYWNIFVTFLVSGIWHGANWTFIVWGILHGVAQIVEKMLGQQKCNYGVMGKTVKIAITFLLVNFFWIFFRMPTLEDACAVVAQIFDVSQPMNVEFNITHMAFSVFGMTILFVKDYTDEFTKVRFFNNRNILVRWAAYVFVLSSILLAGVFGADQFIYSNF